MRQRNYRDNKKKTLSTAVRGGLGFGFGAISFPLILSFFCSLLSIAAESGFCLVELSVQAGNDLPILAFCPRQYDLLG